MTNKYRKKNNNKSFRKNKTFRLDKVSIRYYSLNYKNTRKIPQTQIINYLFVNFKNFLNHKTLCDALNTYSLNFDECFQINQDDFPKGLRKNDIELAFKMNPKTPLDKLIAYCFYIKQPTIFEQNNQQIIELLKYQIGKDVGRDNRNINNKSYNQQYYLNKNTSSDGNINNYGIADLFYQNIIDYLYQINPIIDLNIVNKFALLSCQNVYGLISDLITMQINKMLEPELNSVFRPDKYVNIIIKPEELSMEFYFKSKMLITRDGAPFDPEYPCGDMEFVFFVDILNNVYELKKFIFNYDIDKCGPEIETEIIEKPTKTNLKPEIIIPAAGITAGIIATPILLATLGGKRKKRNKTIKKRKNNK
jgi:hypothetical protein